MEDEIITISYLNYWSKFIRPLYRDVQEVLETVCGILNNCVRIYKNKIISANISDLYLMIFKFLNIKVLQESSSILSTIDRYSKILEHKENRGLQNVIGDLIVHLPDGAEKNRCVLVYKKIANWKEWKSVESNLRRQQQRQRNLTQQLSSPVFLRGQ